MAKDFSAYTMDAATMEQLQNEAVHCGLYHIGKVANNITKSFIETVKWLKDHAVQIAKAIVAKIKLFMEKWDWTKNLYKKIENGVAFLNEHGKKFFVWLLNRIIDGINLLTSSALWATYHVGKATLFFIDGVMGKHSQLSIDLYKFLGHIEEQAKNGKVLNYIQIEEAVKENINDIQLTEA